MVKDYSFLRSLFGSSVNLDLLTWTVEGELIVKKHPILLERTYLYGDEILELTDLPRRGLRLVAIEQEEADTFFHVEPNI